MNWYSAETIHIVSKLIEISGMTVVIVGGLFSGGRLFTNLVKGKDAYPTFGRGRHYFHHRDRTYADECVGPAIDRDHPNLPEFFARSGNRWTLALAKRRPCSVKG